MKVYCEKTEKKKKNEACTLNCSLPENYQRDMVPREDKNLKK